MPQTLILVSNAVQGPGTAEPEMDSIRGGRNLCRNLILAKEGLAHVPTVPYVLQARVGQLSTEY